MITVTYSPEKRQIRMKGHAGYAEDGKDIICSAASTLFFTLCQSLISIEECLAKAPEMEKTKGIAVVSCVPKADCEETIDTIFWTVLNGFHMLANQYPDYLNLKILKY